MFRYVASVVGTLALVFVASSASAAPISVCTPDPVTGDVHCDVTMNGSTYATAAPAFDPGWLVAYTFLLDNGTAYNGAADNANIAAVVTYHPSTASQTSFFDVFAELDPGFAAQRDAALALTDIDGVSLSSGQVIGAPAFNGIGLINLDPTNTIAQLVGVAWADANGGGGSNDSATIILDRQTTTPEVPEPGTLSLMGLGAFGLAFRSWRARRG